MSDKPIIFKFILSEGELTALESLGNTDEVTALALDGYLADPLNRIDGCLPAYNSAGQAQYKSGTKTRFAHFCVPEDFRNVISWNMDGATHLRAAIRDYLRANRVPIIEPFPPPPPPPKPQPIQFAIPVSLLDQIKALGDTVGGHVAKAVRSYYRKYGTKFDMYDARLGDEGNKELTWNAPDDCRRSFPPHECDAAPYIRCAIRAYLARVSRRKTQ